MASGDKIGTQDCKGYAVARMLQLTRSTTPPPGTWESVARTGMGRCPYERGSSLAPPLLGIMPRGTEEIHPRERGSPRRRLAPLQACRAQLGPTLKRQCVGNGRRPSLCAGSIPAWVLGRGPFSCWRLAPKDSSRDVSSRNPADPIPRDSRRFQGSRTRNPGSSAGTVSQRRFARLLG